MQRRLVFTEIPFPEKDPEANEAMPIYFASSRQPKMRNHTFVRYKRSKIKVVFDDILFIKNTGNCLRIEKANRKIIYHNSTMKQFQDILPPENFIRINKSIIVNYNRIERYEKGVIYIKNQAFKVSRIYAARVKDMLKRLG